MRLTDYLALDEEARAELVPAQDAAPSLEAHDKRFHPGGYKKGDACKFRDELEKGDSADLAAAEKEEEGGKDGDKMVKFKKGDKVIYKGQRFWIKDIDPYEKDRPYLIIKEGDARSNGRDNAFYVQGKEITAAAEKAEEDKEDEEAKYIRTMRAEREAEAKQREMESRESLKKMASLAEKVSGMPTTSTWEWDDNGIGYLDIKFPDEESAKKFNYYKVMSAIHEADDLLPKGTLAVGGFKMPERKGNTLRIGVGHFMT